MFQLEFPLSSGLIFRILAGKRGVVELNCLLLVSCLEEDLLRVPFEGWPLQCPFMFSAHIRIVSSQDIPGLQMAMGTNLPRGGSIETLKTYMATNKTRGEGVALPLLTPTISPL